MKHATTRLIFSYWDSLRGERAAPERGEIAPGEIRHGLADAFILELTADRTAHFRLAGTRICAFFTRELKGKDFASLWDVAEIGDAQRCIDTVLEETVGVVAGVVGSTELGSTVDFEMLLLPLRHRGRPHERILGALSPAQVPLWIGHQPLHRLSLTTLRVLSRPPSGADVEVSRAAISPAERRRRFIVYSGGRAERHTMG